MLRGLERGASKAKGFKMNANACEVAKLRERWEEERVMSLESKLEGGGSQ